LELQIADCKLRIEISELRACALLEHDAMQTLRATFCFLTLSSIASPVFAQTPPKEPPPLWDTQLGASFVGTSGNSETSTLGADFQLHRRWPVWQIEATATAVNTTDRGTQTAERYLGSFRGKRALTSVVSFTAGERAERDRLAGIDFRSILDAGLSYALVRDPRWNLDGLTSLAWNHERPVLGAGLDDPVGVLQLLSKTPFSATADSTQRFTWYPDLRTSSAYRSEAEVTAQAAMNSRLALKIGYLWRYSNAPVPGFVKADNTATASIVLRWKAATAAPNP
jgi:putative salt-induced outer membrane protein